jgi:inner membrane protein
VKGEFNPQIVRGTTIPPEDFLWNEAVLSLGISDLRGVKELTSLQWRDEEVPVHPGILSDDLFDHGVTFKPHSIPLDGSASFSYQLDLNGSSGIQFIPVGKETHVAITSRWPAPGFYGAFLPDTREINSAGFTAHWKILDINRNFPQLWSGRRDNLNESAFGVQLVTPVEEYQKTTRTVKYAIMFIALTFIALFLSEILVKVVVHPIQYTLIGLALVLFYVMLLSLSEHIAFNAAYVLSGVAIISLISLYTLWITSNKRIALTISCILIMLYSFLFTILQLEDYALLIGTIGLFIILTLIMYLTRKVDWYAPGKTGAKPS